MHRLPQDTKSKSIESLQNLQGVLLTSPECVLVDEYFKTVNKNISPADKLRWRKRTGQTFLRILPLDTHHKADHQGRKV